MTGLDSRVIRNGRHIDGTLLSTEDKQKIDTALEELQTLPIYIVDAERLHASQIISTARALMLDHGVQVFFVDYLQLMGYDLEEGKHYGLGNGVKQLKAFCKRYNVALVMLAQYHEQKETIRDATDPEKDCALWVHMQMNKDTRDENGLCETEVDIRKNRHGATGKSTILYDLKRFRFYAPGEVNEDGNE
jgi:replicative DNA helicase